jgi:hypothetical protein
MFIYYIARRVSMPKKKKKKTLSEPIGHLLHINDISYIFAGLFYYVCKGYNNSYECFYSMVFKEINKEIVKSL